MNKLKEIRLSKGITQQELSKCACVSLANIKHLEKGDFDFSKCRGDTLCKLANALNVNVETFLK